MTTLRVDADTDPAALLPGIRSDLEQGAVGVALESGVTGDRGGDVIPGSLVRAVAGLTSVTVEVDGHEQADRALRAGATGIMVPSPPDARLRAVAAEHGSLLWLTEVAGPPAAGPPGERLTLEASVGSVPRLARMLGAVRSPVAAARIACCLPRSAHVDDGVIEALVTVAVMRGATVLRCGGSFGHAAHSDVRVVRRCADVATELLCAGEVSGDVMSGGQGVAS